jgi:CDP-glucose 4,6-dehydratase
MINNLIYLKKFWKNKKVFLTGHTGFKGSWLSIFLNLLGAKVYGYSLKPIGKLNFFDLGNLNKVLERSIIGDIRDYKKLKESIIKSKADFIIHMAAQPLVRHSYDHPKYTYEVNTLGTANILNILHEVKFIKSALIITTDKVYKNKNNKTYYKENDNLGGLDPYSNSKSCAELIVNSYINSFFKKDNISIATARAGNVIGGGDFAVDRIIPDYFRALKNKKLFLRYPNAIRPWQHVIDPLYGYILLLMRLHNKEKGRSIIDHSWNFGPERINNKSVYNVVKVMNLNFNNCVEIIKKPSLAKKYYESNLLMLDSTKAKKILKWKPKYNLNQSIKLIAEWHHNYLKRGNILKVSQRQIIDYLT